MEFALRMRERAARSARHDIIRLHVVCPYTPRWLAQLAKFLGETAMRFIMTAELL